MEISEHLGLYQAAEGDGKKFAIGDAMLNQRLQFRIRCQIANFEVEQIGFVVGDAAQAPGEFREFGYKRAVERSLREMVFVVVLAMLSRRMRS